MDSQQLARWLPAMSKLHSDTWTFPQKLLKPSLQHNPLFMGFLSKTCIFTQWWMCFCFLQVRLTVYSYSILFPFRLPVNQSIYLAILNDAFYDYQSNISFPNPKHDIYILFFWMSSFRINIFTLRQCELFKLIVKSTCTKRRFITATGVSQPPPPFFNSSNCNIC